MKLGSWAYDPEQVNLTRRRDGIDLANYQCSGEWRLLKTDIELKEETSSISSVPHQHLTFTIYLQRR